jgi:hypothetical protein
MTQSDRAEERSDSLCLLFVGRFLREAESHEAAVLTVQNTDVDDKVPVVIGEGPFTESRLLLRSFSRCHR